MRELKYEVPREDDGKKLSVILRSRMKLSNRQISHLKFSEGIWLNDSCVHTGVFVRAGDTVRVEVTPVSAYGTRGRPIAATVDGNSLRSGTAKFGGLSVVGI